MEAILEPLLKVGGVTGLVIGVFYLLYRQVLSMGIFAKLATEPLRETMKKCGAGKASALLIEDETSINKAAGANYVRFPFTGSHKQTQRFSSR